MRLLISANSPSTCPPFWRFVPFGFQALEGLPTGGLRFQKPSGLGQIEIHAMVKSIRPDLSFAWEQELAAFCSILRLQLQHINFLSF